MIDEIVPFVELNEKDFKVMLDNLYKGAVGQVRQFLSRRKVASLEEIAFRTRDMHPPTSGIVVHSDICLRFGRRRFLKGREEFRECHNIEARNIGGLIV